MAAKWPVPLPSTGAKNGVKISQIVDGNGLPLAFRVDPANRPDCTLLQGLLEELDRVVVLPRRSALYLDRGYDTATCRRELRRRGLGDQIARKGRPYPRRRDVRWVVERTNSWHHDFKKLTVMTERTLAGARFFVSLANAAITLRELLRRRPGLQPVTSLAT